MRPNNAIYKALERLSLAWTWVSEHLAVWGLLLVVLACLLASLTSCRAVRAIPLTKADSTHTSVYARDTIRLIDSVTTREYHRHDTVYRTRETIRYRDRISLRTDTVYRDKTVVQTLPPERYVPRFYKVCTWVVCLLLAGGMVWVGLRVWLRR